VIILWQSGKSGRIGLPAWYSFIPSSVANYTLLEMKSKPKYLVMVVIIKIEGHENILREG